MSVLPMKVSLVINSASLDRVGRRANNPHRHAGYVDRADLLRDVILPSAKISGFDEILVVGVFEEGEGYQYIPMNPRYRDRRDALYQRDLGFRHSTGDVVVFCHDDHKPSDGFATKLRTIEGDWDILVPKRTHHITGEELNNGHEKFAEADGRRSGVYMGGHCCVFRRWVIAEVPWTTVNTEFWDVVLTGKWKDAGARMEFTDVVSHVDLEAGVLET